jgi:hypothetical protein
MRQTIAGMIAAVAVMSAAPAMACGGLFTGCSPCGQDYVSPCAQTYVAPAPVYVSPAPAYATGCNTCGGGWAYERLPDPVHQYYYVNQGPTYSGPGNFAPRPSYEETALPTYRHHPYYWHHGYRHTYPSVRYGYYPHHTMRYGMMHHHYGWGHREHVLRRYY